MLKLIRQSNLLTVPLYDPKMDIPGARRSVELKTYSPTAKYTSALYEEAILYASNSVRLGCVLNNN